MTERSSPYATAEPSTYPQAAEARRMEMSSYLHTAEAQVTPEASDASRVHVEGLRKTPSGDQIIMEANTAMQEESSPISGQVCRCVQHDRFDDCLLIRPHVA